jgi:CBS domain-containing protein
MHAPRLVGDLMALEPVVVRADAHLAAAAQLMERHGFGGLPVVDAGGTLVGVISEMDLLRARATEHLWANRSGLLVRHLMTSPALTIRRDQPITIAARKMERHHVSRLVVVASEDESLPIGVLAASDLVRAMAEQVPDEPEADPEEPGPSPDPAPPTGAEEPHA